MQRMLPLLWLTLVGLSTYAQQNPVKYAVTITQEDLKKHLTIIASDSMEGRETGTAGQRKAAAYIEQQFQTMGLKAGMPNGTYQQFYPLYTDSMTGSHLKINQELLNYGTDYYVQAARNESVELTADELVFCGYGISEKMYDDYAGKSVTGKIVVLFMGEPRENGLYLITGSKNSSQFTIPGIVAKAEIAKRKGAKAILLIQQNTRSLSNNIVASNSKSNLYFPKKDNNLALPVIILSTESAARNFKNWPIDSLAEKAKKTAPFLQDQMLSWKTPVFFQYQKQRKTIEASNVIAVVEGSDKKNEYVFVTGHYDHLGKRGDKIFHGADDDGSGTVGVLEMAEAFAKSKAAGEGPRRTMVFMTVSGEEKGLWGSEYYSENPVFPLGSTSVDLNIDMVGRKDPNRKDGDNNNYIYVIGHDKLSTELPVINEGVNREYTQLEFDYKYDDPNDQERIYYRSDHYNFARKGVPILFFFDGIHEDYHKTTDTVDKINFDLYEKRIRMIFYTAWEMANRDNMLIRDIPLPAEPK